MNSAMFLLVAVPVTLLNVVILASDRRFDGIIRQNLNYTNEDFIGYKPIRIHMVYQENNFRLFCGRRDVSHAVDMAVKKITQLLQVVPVHQKLLLKSNGCYKETDQGRCVSLRRSYRIQKCGDTVIIPRNHIDGLYLWNETHRIQTVFPAGDGIPNTDFVLYIDYTTTDKCLGEHSVLSYTELCQVDQFDRPIAGYINICSLELCSQHITPFNEEELYKVIVHELFHLLGFSKSHFGYFKRCDIEGTSLKCQPLNSLRIKEIDQKICIVTPAVLREAQYVLGCHYNKTFCVQLDALDYQYTSHWNREFLPNSIMTPYLESVNSTLLDRITLAVFEDSGWYKVDYSKADQYYIENRRCDSEMKFCSDLDKVVCSMNKRCQKEYKTIRTCIFNATRQCSMFSNDGKESCILNVSPEHKEELYSEHSICFMSNLTLGNVSTSLNGRCYQYRCTKSGEIMIKVQMSSWLLCPYNTLITVPGYFGNVECPTQEDIVCKEISGISTKTSTILFDLTSQDFKYRITSETSETNRESGAEYETFSFFCYTIILLSCYKIL